MNFHKQLIWLKNENEGYFSFPVKGDFWGGGGNRTQMERREEKMYAGGNERGWNPQRRGETYTKRRSCGGKNNIVFSPQWEFMACLARIAPPPWFLSFPFSLKLCKYWSNGTLKLWTIIIITFLAILSTFVQQTFALCVCLCKEPAGLRRRNCSIVYRVLGCFILVGCFIHQNYQYDWCAEFFVSSCRREWHHLVLTGQ